MCADLGITIDEFLSKPGFVREFHLSARNELNQRENAIGSQIDNQL